MATGKDGNVPPEFDVRISPNFGYVGTWEAAKDLKEYHELQKSLRFTAFRTSTTFGKTDILKTKKKYQWADHDSILGASIPFDGVPYIILSKNIYECEYGKDHKLNRRIKRTLQAQRESEENGYEDLSKKCPLNFEHSKKRNCPAKIRMKEIMKFPDFKVKVDSRYQRNKVSESLSAAVADGQVRGERRIYIYLPSDNEHEGHSVRNKLCVTRQHVDARVINRIDELVHEGVNSVSDMQHYIRDFVQCTLFNDSPPPERTDTRYFPHDGDVRYHMRAADIIHKYAHLDPEDLEEYITRWQAEQPDHAFYFRKSSSESKLLLIHQTSEQKHLLKKFGNELCYLDATCKTTRQSLPLVLLAVKINFDQHIVASFIMEGEDKAVLKDALGVLKSWNPLWKPTIFMTECQEEEIQAVEESFQGVSVFLCNFHRVSAWERWVQDPANGVPSHDKSALLAMLERITNVTTQEQYCDMVEHLQDTDFWKGNPELQTWFESKWLSNYYRWVQAFVTLGSKKGAEPSALASARLTSHLRNQCLRSLKRLEDLTHQARDADTLNHLLVNLGRIQQDCLWNHSQVSFQSDDEQASDPKRLKVDIVEMVQTESVVFETVAEEVYLE